MMLNKHVCVCMHVCQVMHLHRHLVWLHAFLNVWHTSLNCCKKKKNVCVRKSVRHIMASLSCDPGPHVQPIRANQKAVIRAWLQEGGSVAVGEF